MGNELRGDDAIGIEVVRNLKQYEKDFLKVFEGHTTPESFISASCAAMPTHVLIVDAAELGSKAGDWRLISKDNIKEVMFTTHAIPPTEIANQIERRCSAKVAFLCIQPKSRDVRLHISNDAKKAVNEVVSAILQNFAEKL